jgi:hypothetical protein
LVSRCRSWSHMHLSTHEFVTLSVDWELTKFLETQFGNDFGAHKTIIHLNLTCSQPALFRFSASERRRMRGTGGGRSAGVSPAGAQASLHSAQGRLCLRPLGPRSASLSGGRWKLRDGGSGMLQPRGRDVRAASVNAWQRGTVISVLVISVISVIDKNLSSR